jgi:hypothetical protein
MDRRPKYVEIFSRDTERESAQRTRHEVTRWAPVGPPYKVYRCGLRMRQKEEYRSCDREQRQDDVRFESDN